MPAYDSHSFLRAQYGTGIAGCDLFFWAIAVPLVSLFVLLFLCHTAFEHASILCYACAIINDAVVNSVGGIILDRIKAMVSEALDIYLKQLCIFAVILFVTLFWHLWRLGGIVLQVWMRHVEWCRSGESKVTTTRGVWKVDYREFLLVIKKIFYKPACFSTLRKDAVRPSTRNRKVEISSRRNSV